MSNKNCAFTPKGSSKALSYDEMRAYLLDNYDLVEGGKGGAEPPISESDQKIADAAESDFSGIKKALVDESIIESTTIDKRSTEQMLDEGKQALKSGKVNAEGIISEIINNPRALQPIEVAALVSYKVGLDNSIAEAYKQLDEATAEQDGEQILYARAEIARIEQKIIDYQQMSVLTAYEQSLAFRLRKMLLDSEYNLQTQILKYKANNDGKIPADVEAKMREQDKIIKEANERIAELEKERESAEDREVIENIATDITRENKVKPTAKEISRKLAAKIRKGKLSRPDIFSSGSAASVVWDGAVEAAALITEAGGSIADAIKVGIEKIRESKWWQSISSEEQKESEKAFRDFMKAQKPQIDVTDGKVQIPHSIIRELVENGATNIDDLTNAVLAQIKEEYPDVTAREVRDAITGYGKSVNKTKDEVQKQINGIKRVGKLLSMLEDVQNKIKPMSQSRKRDELSKEEKDLKKKLDAEIRALFPNLRQMSEEQRLANFKVRAEEKIKELEDRIKRQDFNPKPKRPSVELDAEARKLEAKKILAKEKFDYEHEKLLLAKRPWQQKIWQGIVDLINAPKALLASADMSAPLRQGIVLMLSTNPKKTASHFRDMFRFAASQKVYSQWLLELKASPMYPVIKQSGLFIADENAKLKAREDVFVSGILKKVPVAKQIQETGERSYSGFLNRQRVDAFLSGAQNLADMGIDPKTNPEEYKAWANYINNASARGSLGKFEQAANLLNVGFFSPRMIAARINILNPYYYYTMPPYARKMAVKQTGAFLSFAALVAGIAAFYLKNDDDDETDFELDPRSSDFLKIRTGDTRIDMFGGMGGYIRLAAQLFTGEKKSASTGDIETLGAEYSGDDRRDIAVDFLQNKLAPTPSMIVKHWQSKLDKNGNRVDKYGNRLDLLEGVRNLGIPLYLQDLKSIRQEHSAFVTALLGSGSFFGMGVNTYGNVDEASVLKEYNKLDSDYQKKKGSLPSEDEMKKMMVKAVESAQKQHEKDKILRNSTSEQKKLRETDEYKDVLSAVKKAGYADPETKEEMDIIYRLTQKAIDARMEGESPEAKKQRLKRQDEYLKETMENVFKK